MSFKKNYYNNTTINYTHSSYYKKINKLSKPNYCFDGNLVFRKKRYSINKLILVKYLLNYKILGLFKSNYYAYKYLRRRLKLRKPVLKPSNLRNPNPIFYLYNNLGMTTYSFFKKKYLSLKIIKNRLRKYTSPRKFSKKNKYFSKYQLLSKYSYYLGVNKNYNKPSIRLKNYSYGFILKNSPLYLSYKFSLSLGKLLPLKILIKKTIFSFLKPNQIRKSLMLRRQKITYFRFFNRFNKKDMSTKFLLSNYKRLYTTKRLKISFSDSINLNNLSYHHYIKPFYSSLTNNLFLQKFPDYEAFKGEVHIPRVRFKPGYQRLWRESRATLAEALKIKYIYQKQFTKYITRFNRKLGSYHFSRNEYIVSTIILYSRLLSDYNTLVLLNNSNCVFVNGKAGTNLDYILFTGDSIQLLISNWMYTYLKWVNMWTSNRVKKFRKLVYRKNLASSYRIMKSRKQKSNYTPLWIHYTKYDISDIKPFLETDFFTLSSILIYDNFMFDFYTPSWFIEDRQLIYKLYNWKYIT